MTGRDEDLDYISSSPLLNAPVDTNPTDEADMPALKIVEALLDEQIASYSSIDQLDPSNKDLTIEQQLAVNKKVQTHLQELKIVINTVVEKVREKYR